ncbi:G-protein coupled receptor 4 [Lates calcarifer]|uniref:G-protein coupled receptor 4 n=1 Tax=Lates calcarifer TaxID=8187 RepID=A0AAJ7L818_LATCA|nr:G-protein coupled receptor 4 [Lates calcarifer]
MEDFYNNNTSQNTSNINFPYSNITESYGYNNNSNEFSPDESSLFIIYVVTCIIIGIGLPLTLVAIYGVYSLVRNDHVAPIYIINLLISDLIQFCCMIALVTELEDWKIREIFIFLYYFGLLASVGFMVCVALERYLVIAWPLWYRFRRNIKVSIVVCVVVWALPLAFLLPLYFEVDFDILIIAAVYLLTPLPLFIFSLVGTLKALSASRVSSDEKRRIVAVLVVVLLTYMLLFLPTTIWCLDKKVRYNDTLIDLSFTLIQFSPLADLFLYVFIRKGAVDKILASLCCCRMESNDISRSTVTE